MQTTQIAPTIVKLLGLEPDQTVRVRLYVAGDRMIQQRPVMVSLNPGVSELSSASDLYVPLSSIGRSATAPELDTGAAGCRIVQGLEINGLISG